MIKICCYCTCNSLWFALWWQYVTLWKCEIPKLRRTIAESLHEKTGTDVREAMNSQGWNFSFKKTVNWFSDSIKIQIVTGS